MTNRFAEWLQEEGLTQREAEDLLGVSQTQIGHLANGTCCPRLDTACRIVRGTGGAVQYEDMLPSEVREELSRKRVRR